MSEIESNSQQLQEIEEIRKKLGLSSAYIPGMRRLRANLIIHIEVLEAEFASPKLQELAQNLFKKLSIFESKQNGVNCWQAKFIETFGDSYLKKLTEGA